MDERTLSMNRLAAGIVMTCKGMPFFQAGEEFARTKHGEGNSFKSSWQLNKIDWTRALEQEELVDYYRGLLALRRKFQAYGTCEPDCKRHFSVKTRSQVTNWNTRMAAQSASSTIHGKKKLCRNFRKETETALRWKTLCRGWSRDERKHDASGKIDGSAGAGVKL